MRGFRSSGLVLAATLIAGALLVPAGTAQAAPPSPGNSVAQGKNWQVLPVAGGYRVTLHLDAPAPKRDALPLIAVDGVPVGPAKLSPDQRTLWLTSPDPALRNAQDVRLAWSGDQLGKQSKSLAGGATDKYWLNAPLGPKLAVDPGAAGKYQVDTAEYNLGDEAVYLPGLGHKSEIAGKVYSPRGAIGTRPLVIFLHGRHESCYGDAGDPEIPWPCAKGQKPVPSYRGYDGPAEALAGHGYQVVSISSNAINGWDSRSFDQGAQARAELILDHLHLWKKWATVGSGPFGRKFVGRIDFTNIGLMGHSRGGEGVARAAVLNADRGGKYGIRAVLPLAPTDFARATVPGVAMSVILPYCDGDVSDLQGQKFYDDTRYSVTGDPAARSTVLVMGANHNFFNTEWTPGQSVAPSIDDWEYTDPENPKGRPCGSEYAGRLTAKEQQAVGTAYIAGFFRLQLGHETKLLPLLDGSNAHPASAGRAVVRVVSQAAGRLDVNRLDKALPVTGKATASVCAGTRRPDAEKAPATCVETQTPSDSPHWVEAWFASTAQTTAVTKLDWTGTNGVLEVGLTAAQRDVRKYSALTFRAAPDPASASKLDLTVRMVDGRGRKVDVPVSAVSDALVRLPGAAGTAGLPKNLLRTVRIPTSLLKGIDLRDVRSIELRTDKVAKGSVFLSDLAFSTPGLGRSAPTRLPQLSASSVGKVVEGDKVKTYDIAVTLSRPSVRPVTVHAESNGDEAPVAHDLVFKPGQTRKQLKVTVTGNTRDSYDHFVSLVLSVPTEAQLGSSFGNIEVLDDDPAPALTVLPVTAAENAGQLAFRLKLSAPSDKYIYLRGELKDGAALARKDYRAPGDESSGQPFRDVYGALEPGEITGELVAELVDDKVKEPTETFTVTLLEVIGADLGVPATATGTITDDD
ncbi:hypothetical protein OHA70_01825 [Kribbella sp. NBC_00382]|uniref:Calx-beta domain-containing protein n=1 Tax=Kribbella sp. NBC_00382 TaxID=2975967 RepID=UPI002E1DF97A